MFDLDSYYNHTVVITDAGETMQYGQLKEEVDKLTPFLHPHKLAFCLCRNQIGCLMGYITFMNAGVPVVLLDGQKNEEVVESLLTIYKPAYLWVSEDRTELIKDHKVLYSTHGFSLVAYNEQAGKNPSRIALLLTTSGSTGSPKLVKLTRENLLSNCRIDRWISQHHLRRASCHFSPHALQLWLECY